MSKNAKIRLLVADDHAILRSGLRMLINGQPDMEVVGEAEDGEGALQKAAESQPDVAILNNPTNWYSLANGGPGPEVVLVRDLKSISELQGVPGKTVDQIVQEAYGDQGAAVM